MKKTASVLTFLGFLLMGGLLEAQDSSFKIIANASNPVSSLTRAQVSRLFLKKTSAWENGQKVYPVDQKSTSSVRAKFSKGIHGKKVSAIKSYWQQQIFSGRGVPPSEKTSDEQVLNYVRETTGAIGYVSAGATTNGVKVIKIRE